MKQKPYLRCLSVLLILCLLLSGLPVSGAAAQAVGAEESLSPAPEPPLQEETITPEPLDTGGILSLVDAQTFEAQGFTRRVTEDESLSTYVFQKETGEKTVYFFGENVKYEKDGVIYHKDLTLVPQSGGYGVAQNEVALHLPQNPAKGILVAYEGMGIRILPQGLASGIQAVAENGAVVYENAYGNGIDLKYTPIFSGVKEDIILPQYMQEASFSFLLETVGASLYQDSQGWYLAADAQAEPSLRMGDTLVYDAIGKPCQGGLTVETVTPGSQYRVTVSAPDSFLSDPETVYPVTVDPSITISVDLNGSDAIDDASIFEYLPDYNYGSLVYNNVGTTNASMGRSRTVIKLNELIRSAEYTGITNPEQIESVYFYAAESSGRPAQRILIYPLLNESWTVSNVTWNNVGAYSTSLFCSGYLTDSQWTGFDITRLVRAWKAGTYPANGGFIMINENESDHKSFFANNGSYYHPYVTMQYGTFENAETIQIGTPTNVSVTNQGEHKYFSVISNKTELYSFSSVCSDGDPRMTLYNSDKQLLATVDDIDDEDYNFCLTYLLAANVQYYLAVTDLRASGDVFQISIQEANSFTFAQPTTAFNTFSTNVSCENSYQVRVIPFIPAETQTYTIYTEKTSGDPYLRLYTRYMELLAYDDDSAGNGNSKIVITLNKGAQYYIVAGHYGNRTGSYLIRAIAPIANTTSIFAIKTYNNQYIDYTSLYTGASLIMSSLNADRFQQVWQIIASSDGYYFIQSVYNSSYYLGLSTDSTAVILLNEESNYTKWKIYTNSYGQTFFEPKNKAGWCLGHVESSLQLCRLGTISSTSIAWERMPRTKNILEGQQSSSWCWLAVARMFAKHYCDVPDYKTQAWGAADSFGNKTTSIDDIIDAINYFTSNMFTGDSIVGEEPRRLIEPSLQGVLELGDVVIVCRYPYHQTQRIGDGHAMIIVGYDHFDGNTHYLIYDPMPQGEIPADYDWESNPGCMYWLTYDELSEGEDELLWDTYIVKQSSYADDCTVPHWLQD